LHSLLEERGVDDEKVEIAAEVALPPQDAPRNHDGHGLKFAKQEEDGLAKRLSVPR
jgi:hypothetical protein